VDNLYKWAVKLYSLALDIVSPSKISSVFSKEEEICYKMVCYTLYFG